MSVSTTVNGITAKVKIRVGQMKMEVEGSELCVNKEVEAFTQFIKDCPAAANPITVNFMDMLDDPADGEPSETTDLKVGDVFPCDIETGKPGKGLVLDIKDNVATCIYYDCLTDAQQMNDKNTNEGGYEESDLRKLLNGEILGNIPEYTRERMIPFENGDYLMPPSEKEIIGKNEYGEEEPEEVKQFEPMKSRRNRIAFRGEDEDLEWYWLRNKRVASSSYFAHCNSYGRSGDGSASSSHGVRPLFKIRVS